MFYERSQFREYDTLEGRKYLMDLFRRLGDGLSYAAGCNRRQRFLQSLIGLSTTGMDGKPLRVSPCSAVEAYCLFGAITGCLGVDVDAAAKRLERLVQKGVLA